jgi:hypothetical protein
VAQVQIPVLQSEKGERRREGEKERERERERENLDKLLNFYVILLSIF